MHTIFRTAMCAAASAISLASAALDVPAAYSRIKSADFERGYVRCRVESGGSYDFSAPPSAVCSTNFALRGGATAYERVPLPTWRFPLGSGTYGRVTVMGDGTLYLDDSESIPSGLGSLGVVPRERWPELPASCAAACPQLGVYDPAPVSVVWSDMDGDGVTFTWQNALLDRDASRPVSYQVRLSRGGAITMHFDLSRVPAGDPVFVSMYQAFGAARPTLVEYRRLVDADLVSADRDGDGIDTERELFDYHTDPGNADTDGDSLFDLPEALSLTSQSSGDTDGDGYGDATDPDPRSPTSWDDSDGDGLPDAWVAKWFGGAADPHADPGGDGIDNLSSLHMGVRPTTSRSLGTGVSGSVLPRQARAFRIVPLRFSFRCPEGMRQGHPDYEGDYRLVRREFAVDRVSPWQQFFVTSDLETFAGWSSSDIEMTWEAVGADDAQGDTHGVIPADAWDSFRIPVPHGAVFTNLCITVRVAGDTPTLSRPLFLVAWMPRVELGADDFFVNRRQTSAGVMYLTFNRDRQSGYRIPCSVDFSWYPHAGGLESAASEALALPVLPGVEYVGQYLSLDGLASGFVNGESAALYMPRQGSQPRVGIVVYRVRR